MISFDIELHIYTYKHFNTNILPVMLKNSFTGNNGGKKLTKRLQTNDLHYGSRANFN